MIVGKLVTKKPLEAETENTEHPYQVNLANFESKAIRELFTLDVSMPNSRVGQELYLYAISKKLEEIGRELTPVEYLNSFKTK